MGNQLGYLVCLALNGINQEVTRGDLEHVNTFLSQPVDAGHGPLNIIREALSVIDKHIRQDIPENVQNRAIGGGSQVETIEALQKYAIEPELKDETYNPYFLVVRATQHMREARVRGSFNSDQKKYMDLRDAIFQKSIELGILPADLELFHVEEEGEEIQVQAELPTASHG